MIGSFSLPLLAPEIQGKYSAHFVIIRFIRANMLQKPLPVVVGLPPNYSSPSIVSRTSIPPIQMVSSRRRSKAKLSSSMFSSAIPPDPLSLLRRIYHSLSALAKPPHLLALLVLENLPLFPLWNGSMIRYLAPLNSMA